MNKTDRRILATAFLLLILMLYFLYDDSLILPSDHSQNLIAVGKISQVDHDVRRKVSKQFIWRSARSKDSIHIGDSVFTGQGSVVQIELNDGRKLTLQENSLIEFKTQGDQLNLDLRSGKVAGNINGCLKINIKGTMKDVCGNNSDVEVDAEEGEVKVATAEKPKEKIITWVNRAPAHLYHYKKQIPLKASWKADESYGRFRFQLSKQESFKKIIFEEKTQSNEISTINYPVNGEYFVRIQADDLKGRPTAFSKVEKMEIKELGQPVITSPLALTKFSVRRDVDGELVDSNQVKISWKYELPNARFDIELARDKEFTQILSQEKDVPATSYQTAKLNTGDYYVRVRDTVTVGSVHRPWSPTVNFRLEIQAPPQLPVPQVLTEKVDYLAPSPEDLHLKWQPVEKAKQYHIEVAKDPDFTEVKEYTSEKTEWSLPSTDITPGRAYFRVTAETAKGTQSESSTLGKILVRLKTPELDPAELPIVQGKTPEDPGDPQTLKVGWSDLKYADGYVVEVAEDAQFKNKKEYTASTPNSEIVLPHPGDYYWRVKAVNKAGKALTQYSKTAPLKYILRVPLATPDLIEPFDQATLYFQKNISPYVWFEWKTVRQAAIYNLEVATDAEFKNKVLTIQTKSHRHLLKEQLPMATLYWRVQAEGDGRVSFWTPPRMIQVFSGRTPAGRAPTAKQR